MLLTALLAGCAGGARQPSYADEIAQRPLPEAGLALEQECQWLETESRHVEKLAENMKNSRFALEYQSLGRDRQALLAARQRLLGCPPPDL